MNSRSNFIKVIANHTIIFQVAGLQFFSLSRLENQNFYHRYKFNFGAVLILLSALVTGMLYAMVENPVKVGDENVLPSTVVYGMAVGLIFTLVLFSMAFSYAKTENSMKILTNFDEVMRIFTTKLNHKIEIEVFGRNFKRACFSVFITIFIVTSLYLIFLFGSKTKAQWIFYSIFFVIIELYFEIIFLRFVFFTMLVNFNLKSLENFVVKLHKNLNSIVVIPKSFSPKQFDSDNYFEVAMSLKKIYGLILMSTKLINEICGPLNTFTVIGIVFALLTDGFQIYLWYKKEISSDEVFGEILKSLKF